MSSVAVLNLPFYFKGFTGSGKTEVLNYPKIAWIRARQLFCNFTISWLSDDRAFYSTFWGTAILHSGLSMVKNYDEWRKVERGDAQVVVGARSYLLLSWKKNRVSLIIDEEHEAAYSLGTAIPMPCQRSASFCRLSIIRNSGTWISELESRARAGKGVYQHRLTQRPVILWLQSLRFKWFDFQRLYPDKWTSNFYASFAEEGYPRQIWLKKKRAGSSHAQS